MYVPRVIGQRTEVCDRATLDRVFPAKLQILPNGGVPFPSPPSHGVPAREKNSD